MPARLAPPQRKKSVTTKDLHWATHIFVMEKKHNQRLIAQFRRLIEHKRIIILDIPDEYQFMDDELVSILNDSVESYL